jgi:hypothetical protein
MKNDLQERTRVSVRLAPGAESQFWLIWSSPNQPHGVALREDAETLERTGYRWLALAIDDGAESEAEGRARHPARRARILTTGVVLTEGETLTVGADGWAWHTEVYSVGPCGMPVFVPWATVLSVAAKAATEHAEDAPPPRRGTRR